MERLSVNVAVARVGSVETPLPAYQSVDAAGIDLPAAVEKARAAGEPGGIDRASDAK